MASSELRAKVEVDLSELQASSSNSVVYDAKATRRLLRKIDWHLLPFLALLYLPSFLDRSNFGNARLAGIERSLSMTGLDYNVYAHHLTTSLSWLTIAQNALAVFFPFYIISEIPSNIILKKIGPAIWIPTLIVTWGIVCTLMGVVQNHAGLMAARSFLGLAVSPSDYLLTRHIAFGRLIVVVQEGGLFPGVAFVITTWYKRTETGFRIALFFSAATVAGAFGGLLARAIMFSEYSYLFDGSQVGKPSS